MTVSDLNASDVFVVSCSEGLKFVPAYFEDEKPIVANPDELIDLMYVEIAAGGWIELLTVYEEKGEIRQKIEALEEGALHSSKGINTFEPTFVKPGVQINLSGVSWKSE